MNRWPTDIEVEAIIISDEKADYIARAHGVTRADAWSVFNAVPRYLADEFGRYSMIGQSPEGRYLLLGLMPTEKASTWWLVTAYWLRSSRGERLYGES